MSNVLKNIKDKVSGSKEGEQEFTTQPHPAVRRSSYRILAPRF
jgi:hypothetical protein